MAMLAGGDQLPNVRLRVGASGAIELPGDIDTDYAVILFYRGHW